MMLNFVQENYKHAQDDVMAFKKYFILSGFRAIPCVQTYLSVIQQKMYMCLISSSKSVKQSIVNQPYYSEIENMDDIFLLTPTYIRESHTFCLSHKD